MTDKHRRLMERLDELLSEFDISDSIVIINDPDAPPSHPLMWVSRGNAAWGLGAVTMVHYAMEDEAHTIANGRNDFDPEFN